MKPRPPSISKDLEDLSLDDSERHSECIDIFGLYLMWMRSITLRQTRARVTSEVARQELGTILRRSYDLVSQMGDDEQEVCIRFAERCMDEFAQELLLLLDNQGDDLKLGRHHSLRFRLDLEIYDMESGKLVDDETINRGRGLLSERWGKWINRLAEKFEHGPDEVPPVNGSYL